MKALAKALAIFGAGSALSTSTQVIKGKLGAVLLGVEGVGVLNQLTNVWGLLHTLAGLGFYNGIVHSVAAADAQQDQRTIRAQFTSAVVMLTAFSVAATAVAVALAGHVSAAVFADGGARAWMVAIVLMSVPFSVVAQIYTGLFSGLRLVRIVVSTQVISDVTGLLLFAVLAYAGNLWGAAAAFSLMNVAKLAIQVSMAKRHLPRGAARPDWILFEWGHVRRQAEFGFSGLLLVSVSIATTMLVSREIIASIGLHANGIFSVAWKVCSLYFGALYASASGYYFPLLSSTQAHDDLSRHINDSVALYMYILTPLAALLMIGGETLMTILFSSEFAAGAELLLFLLPADLLRILSETIALSFLAKRKLVSYNSSYLLWAGAFLTLAYVFVPMFGLLGIGYAYAASHVFNALVVLWLARRHFSFSLSRHALHALALGAVTLISISALMRSGMGARQLLCLPIIACWILGSWRDAQFQGLVRTSLDRLRAMTRPRTSQ